MRKQLFLFLTVLLAVVGFVSTALADDPKDDDDAAPAQHAPVAMKLGMKIQELGKLDLTAETFQAEFFVTVTCDHEPCKPNLDVANGKLLGKPEKLKDDPLFKEYKIKAELGALLDFSEYPYDSHALQIVLEDKGDPERSTMLTPASPTRVGSNSLAGSSRRTSTRRPSRPTRPTAGRSRRCTTTSRPSARCSWRRSSRSCPSSS
jgi:hypothetical protein